MCLSYLSWFLININVFIVNILIFRLLLIIIVLGNDQYNIRDKCDKCSVNMAYNIHVKQIQFTSCWLKKNHGLNIGWNLSHCKSWINLWNDKSDTSYMKIWLYSIYSCNQNQSIIKNDLFIVYYHDWININKNDSR